MVILIFRAIYLSKFGVLQSLADIQPDVDAIYRMSRKTPFLFKRTKKGDHKNKLFFSMKNLKCRYCSEFKVQIPPHLGKPTPNTLPCILSFVYTCLYLCVFQTGRAARNNILHYPLNFVLYFKLALLTDSY